MDGLDPVTLVVQGAFAALTGYLLTVWIPRTFADMKSEREAWTAERKAWHAERASERETEWARHENAFRDAVAVIRAESKESLAAVREECRENREDFRSALDRIIAAMNAEHAQERQERREMEGRA